MRCWPIVLLSLLPCLAGPQERVEVRSTTLAITFDATGGPVGLVELAGQRQLLAEPNPRLFVLTLREPDGRELNVTNRDAATVTLERAGDAVTITCADFGGRGGRAVCAIAGGAELRWRIAVTPPPGLRLVTVRYPTLTFAAPLTEGQGERLVVGATKGGVWLRPSAWPAGRWQAFAIPGSLAAQFGTYYDDTLGVATMALDAAGHPKHFAAARTGTGLELTWLWPLWTTETVRQTWDVVVTAYRGAAGPADWRDAADLYRSWAVRQPWCATKLADREDLPRWLRAGPALVRFNRAWLTRPESITGWLDDYWRRWFPRVPLLVAYWGWEKVDTWVTPDYFPVYPSDDAFRAVERHARNLDGHAFFWPSGYHYTLTYDRRDDGTFRWDDRERFDREIRPHAVVGRDGQVLIGPRSWLRGGETATLCPGDPWTRDWFTRLAVECARRGVEMIQIDQVVGAGFPACYSADHGHPPGPGPWMTEALRQQLAATLAACRAIEPEAVVCFEEPNEWFIQQVGVQDYRDWEVLRRGEVQPASVFGYVYHDYLPCFQSNPRADDRLLLAHCVVTGQLPHLVPSERDRPGPALVNGGLDEWAGPAPRGWDKVAGYQGAVWTGEAFRDEVVKVAGAASLRLVNDQPDEVVQVSQNVGVDEAFRVGGTYRLSARVRSEGLVRDVGIGLGTFTAAMKSTGGWSLPIPRQTDWIERSATFTVPPDSSLLRIMIHIVGPGTVWVDELRLEELTAAGAKEVIRTGRPPTFKLLRRWVELFAGEGRPFLFEGRMLRPPRVAGEAVEAEGRRFPAVAANAFEAPDGRRALVLCNATATTQTAQVTWAGRTATVTLAPDDIQLLERLP